MLSRLQVEEFRSRACVTLPMPTMVPSHVWEWLRRRRRLLANSVAASTSRVYGSGLNQYLAFCREVGIPHPFPLQEFVLELFVALRDTRLFVATLRTYLAGLQHFSFRFGFLTKVAGIHSLEFVLRGLRRSQANRFTRPPRRPITVTTLIPLRAYIHWHFPARDAIMLLAAIFSAFFGLLRSAEYCSPFPGRFDPGVHLQYRDLTLGPCASRHQRQIPSGGGGGGEGGGGGRAPLPHRLRSLSLHRVTPVAWHAPNLRLPVVRIPGRIILDPGPLGAHPPGVFPSSYDLNTHSFRIGGASTAGAMGFSSAMIQVLGRWRSDSFRRYVQLPSKYVFQAQLRMQKFSE